MKNFAKQWKSLEEHRDEDDPNTPKITKDLPVMRWVESSPPANPGKRSDFELMVAYLLPNDPVAREKEGNWKTR